LEEVVVKKISEVEEISKEHSVNPETGRCVHCGRNEFNRQIQPKCLRAYEAARDSSRKANVELAFEDARLRDHLRDTCTAKEAAERELDKSQVRFGKAMIQSTQNRMRLEKAEAERDKAQAACAEITQVLKEYPVVCHHEEDGDPDCCPVCESEWKEKIAACLNRPNPGQPLLERLKLAEAKCAEILQTAAERPGVAEWAHLRNCWLFAGREYEDVKQADFEAFNEHLRWSEKLVHLITEANTGQSILDQRAKLIEACEFASGAIEDAIGLEDGLDGGTGEAVLEMLDKAVGRDLCPTKGQRPMGRHLLAELSALRKRVPILLDACVTAERVITNMLLVLPDWKGEDGGYALKKIEAAKQEAT
jgi:hypothetical protein